jgi:lysophospholipase L1-like esterase
MPRHFLTSVVLAVGLLGSMQPMAAQTYIQPPVTPGGTAPAPLQIQPPTVSQDLRIVWEVKNRFRLFRREADFLRQVAAQSLKTVLQAEQLMEAETDGRGWASRVLANLCVDPMGGVMNTCERDGTRESYLAPADHRVEMKLVGAAAGTSCAWVFDEGDGQPRSYNGPCSEEVRIRLVYGKPTTVTVDVAMAEAPPLRAQAEIAVRDLLIAGMGDSVAAGEGNPDRPVKLSDEGFCFRRFGTGSEYYRPGRATFTGDRTCENSPNAAGQLTDWAKLGARWLSQACHRSLYGYQLRTALALAVENPHVAVTFLPLACTGATIDTGVLGAQNARELNCAPSQQCPRTVPAQITTLQQYLAIARRGRPNRPLDLVLLTVGANDIDFSGLVADVIIDASRERVLFNSMIASVDAAERALTRNLPGGFQKLRTALRPMVGGDLSRVVYVTYGNPALRADGTPCGGGQTGFDVHPAFKVDGERMRRVADFVTERFLPTLKAIAQCSGGTICANPEKDRMTFVEAHQQAFLGHGVCARSEQDPEFDRACFLPDGKSFSASAVEGATEPLACGASPSEYRAYTPRARWIRTANDSYFAAMTYPEGLPLTQQPSDIHDATWGIVSAVYGGAVHPTAEGHAAMADAALDAARQVLNLGAGLSGSSVSSQPLAPPNPQ